ncbi:MAG: hypothetical protein AAFO82_01670 [Bacteroidota bacterium]
MDTIRQERITITREKNVKKAGTDQSNKVVYNKALRNSIITAALMAAYLFIVQIIASPETASYIKPASYLIMLGMFYFTLKDYKSQLPKGKIFTKGSLLGLFMSAITSAILVAVMTALKFIFGNVEFSKFTKEVDTFNEMITFDWILLFQTFVFGIIVTFIVLQGIKDSNRTR